MPRPHPISRISSLMLSVALTAVLLRGWARWPRRGQSAVPSIPGMTFLEVGPGLSTGLRMNAMKREFHPDMPRSGPFCIGVGASGKSPMAASRTSPRTSEAPK